MIYSGSLAGALLPVEQSVSLLKHKVQVVLLQSGKLAYLAILVYEGGIIEIFGKSIVRFHIRKWLVLYIVEPTLTADNTPRNAYLSHILFGCYLRHRQRCAIQYEVIDACRLVFHLINSRGAYCLSLKP